jgi:hypothetical protein
LQAPNPLTSQPNTRVLARIISVRHQTIPFMNLTAISKLSHYFQFVRHGLQVCNSRHFVTVNIKKVDAHCAGSMTCFYIKLLTRSIPVTQEAQPTLFQAETNVLGSACTPQKCCISQTKPPIQRFRVFPKSMNIETLKTLHLVPLPSFPPQNFVCILYSYP